MLSLLLNKNPWLSLRVVSHRLLWSLVVWQEGASEVSRQEDKSIDIPVDGWMDGRMDCSSAVTLCLHRVKAGSHRASCWKYIECSFRTLLCGHP